MFHSIEINEKLSSDKTKNLLNPSMNDLTSTKEMKQRSIVIIGYGSVGRCTLPLIKKYLSGDLTPKSITVIDCVKPPIENLLWLEKMDIHFEEKRIEEETYETFLSDYLNENDVLIDLLFNVSTEALVRWCQKHRVLYINTTVDVWFLSDKGGNLFESSPFEAYNWHKTLIRLKSELNDQLENKRATALVEHGANPGLISHFVKRGLEDMTTYLLNSGLIKDRQRKEKLFNALKNRDYCQLSYLLGIKSIHLSERDSQTTSRPRQRNELVNTWCPSALFEEAFYDTQFAWGTHETDPPLHSIIENEYSHQWSPQRISFPNKCLNVWIRSWVPSGPIMGMAIAHPEIFSIADYLTIRDEQGKRLVYQPSVYFVYLPCDSAICSLHEWKMQNYPPIQCERVMSDDILSGADELGVLFLGGKEIPAWWTGSVLDIDQTRSLVNGHSATTLQVAIGVLSGLLYALKYPDQGFCFPEDINTDEILSIALPYLGHWISQPVDWTNKSNSSDDLHPDEQWKFNAFRVDFTQD